MSQFAKSNAAEFQQETDDVFGRIARRYDYLSDLFSLGMHRLWKRKVARIIADEPWETLIDTGTGTGDIVLRVVNYCRSRENLTVVASDSSSQMLQIAKGRVQVPTDWNIDYRRYNAEVLDEVLTDSFDCYSMSLCLKICDRHKALQEAFRVLKPGGLAVFLEASDIPIGWLRKLYLKYMEVCMPLIGWAATGGDKSAYRYLLNGIKEFPDAEALANELRETGFVNVQFQRLTLGIVAIHTARKPADR